jgi:LysM repeat protein
MPANVSASNQLCEEGRMKRLVPISVFVLAALLLSITPLAASAQAGPTTIYVVQPGDTAYSIATRHCMTVQELSNLNGAVITNPNMLYPGMQLRVVNRCGSSSGGGWNGGGGWNCSVFDRGPRVHAMGSVFGNTYFVALGDTAFSIGQRFGISTEALARANNINPWYIWAGERLIIPGLGSCQQPCPGPSCQLPCWGIPCQQPCYPNSGYCTPMPTSFPPITVIPITPTPTGTPVVPRIQITSPAPNTTLPPTFIVTGTGAGLFEGTVVVRAVTNVGQILAEVPTTLQGANVGAGGPGTFSVQVTVNVSQPTAGFVVAFAPQTPTAPAVSVPVVFSPGGGGGVTYHDYQGAQCRVAVIVGQPFYDNVGGNQIGTFANPGNYTATRGAKQNNQFWFYIGPLPTTPASVWVPSTSIANGTPACFGW